MDMGFQVVTVSYLAQHKGLCSLELVFSWVKCVQWPVEGCV
jgi:hypothetical protein